MVLPGSYPSFKTKISTVGQPQTCHPVAHATLILTCGNSTSKCPTVTDASSAQDPIQLYSKGPCDDTSDSAELQGLALINSILAV